MVKITAQTNKDDAVEVDVTIDGLGSEVVLEACAAVRAMTSSIRKESEEAMMDFINLTAKYFTKELAARKKSLIKEMMKDSKLTVM